MPRPTRTGGRAKRGKANPTSVWRIDRHLRAIRAMNLRSIGWTWGDVASSAWPIDASGEGVPGAGTLYDHRMQAQRAVDRLLMRYAVREIEAYRLEMVEQLDTLIAGNFDAACGVINGQDTGMPVADAVRAVMFAMERKAKLLGLDAPSRAELTGKDGRPLFSGGEGLGSLLIDAERYRVRGGRNGTPALGASLAVIEHHPDTETGT